jgi:hypothetical protein
MHPMRLSLAFAVASAFAFSMAPRTCAQEPARDSGFGRVTGLDGKPWVGAEVHLLHRPHVAVTDPACGERHVLVSDAKGQFRVDLLVGSAYWAWAIGPLEADGGYRVTGLRADAVARTPILLTEGERSYVRRLRPERHASWDAHAALRWRAGMAARPHLSEWLTPDAGGLLVTPRWPTGSVTLEAWAGDWLAFSSVFPIAVSTAVRLGLQWQQPAPKPEAAEAPALLAAVHAFAVPERRTREITVRSADGTPVAGAEVRLERMPADVAPTRTDATGVVLAVFADADAAAPRLPARCTILPPGANAEFSLSPSSYRQGEPPVVVRELPPGQHLDGRLSWRADEPAGDVPLLVEGSVASGGGGVWFGIDPRVFRTAADGSFTIPGRSEQHSFRLTVALSPAARARLATGGDATPVAPLAVLRWASGALPKTLGDVVLGRLLALDVAVREADGSPPGTTTVLLKELDGGTSAPHDPVAVHTDHRGRVRVLVPDTANVLVHATTARGAAWQRLDAAQRSAELTLDARHVMRFRVVDGAGAPIPHATVTIVAPAGIGGEVPNAIRDMCLVNAFSRKTARADGDGLGELVTPVVDAMFDVSIVTPTGNRRIHVQWNGPDGDRRIDLVVR